MPDLPVDHTFMTTREIVMEIRQDLKELSNKLARHLDEYEIYKTKLVTKDELNLMENLRRTTRRYLITTVISLTAVIVTIAGVLIATRPG